MKKCSYADSYQAKRAPTCHGGRVCHTCAAKWAAANSDLVVLTQQEFNQARAHIAGFTDIKPEFMKKLDSSYTFRV